MSQSVRDVLLPYSCRKAEGVEGMSDLRCLRKPGFARRVLAEATSLRKFRRSDTDSDTDRRINFPIHLV